MFRNRYSTINQKFIPRSGSKPVQELDYDVNFKQWFLSFSISMKVYLFTLMIRRTLDIHFKNIDTCLKIWNIWMFQE